MTEPKGMILHTEGSFTGAGGLVLYEQSWRPAGRPRAAVVVVHGFGEHGGRYGNVVEALVPRGHALYTFDLRGHGRSPGIKGHISSWDEYRTDVSAFLGLIRAEQPGIPLFLMGHSMGALIVLEYATCGGFGAGGISLTEPDAVIASSSPIIPCGVTKPHLVFLAHLLSRIWPTFSMVVGLEHAALSRSPECVQAYGADPLVHGRATARWGTEAMAALERVKAHVGALTKPLLLIHGEADRIDDAAGSRWFYERAGSTDKTLLTYPGCYHELHNDLDRAQVLADLGAWIEDRAARIRR